MSVRSTRLTLVLVASAFVISACTVDEGTATVASTTTTTAAPAGDDTDLPELPGAPAAEVRAALERATDERDVCAVIAAIDLGVPETTDGDEVVAAYEALARAFDRGETFRPEELAAAWTTVEEGLGSALEELKATGGQTDAPSVVAVFTTDAMQAASSRIERWADEPADRDVPDGPTNCPAAPSG